MDGRKRETVSVFLWKPLYCTSTLSLISCCGSRLRQGSSGRLDVLSPGTGFNPATKMASHPPDLTELVLRSTVPSTGPLLGSQF